MLRKLRKILADVLIDISALFILYKCFDIDLMESTVMAFIPCVGDHGNSHNELGENKFGVAVV